MWGEAKKSSPAGGSSPARSAGARPPTNGMLELRADAAAFLLERPGEAPAADSGGPGGLSRTVSQLAAQWVAEDPGAASRWVAGPPAGDERTWAMMNRARHWPGV